MVDVASQKRQISILMLGEALDRPGGVVTVEKATLALASPHLDFRHIATLPKDEPGAGWRKLGMALSALVQLPVRLLTSRVDAVHIHVSQGASVYRKMLLAWIVFLFGKPLIFHTHGGDVAKRFPTLPAPLRRMIAWTYRRADLVIALGEAWRRFYIDAMGVEDDRAIILRNPVPMPATLPTRPAAPPLRLLYLGMLSEPKGAFDLIDAIASMPEEDRSGLRLIMAGHGEIDRARSIVAAQKLEQVIEIRGWIGPVERDALFRDVHGLVLPSHFEGMPMALLEAMSFGLAVIATPVGAIPDVVVDGRNGFLVPVADQAALAASIKRLLDDATLCQDLGKTARESVEPFSIAAYEAHLMALYRNLTTDRALSAKAS